MRSCGALSILLSAIVVTALVLILMRPLVLTACATPNGNVNSAPYMISAVRGWAINSGSTVSAGGTTFRTLAPSVS